MQAIVLSELGGPEALHCEQRPDPVAGAHQVLVELRAAAVNRRDTLVCGTVGLAHRCPLPLVLGSDGAGIRRDTGEAVMILPSLGQQVLGTKMGSPRDFAEMLAAVRRGGACRSAG